MAANRTGVKEFGTKRERLCFAFRIDAGNNPDAIRQEKGRYITSVVRAAAGRFTVTCGKEVHIQQITDGRVTQHNPDESPVAATFPAGGYIKNLDFVVATRTFEVVTIIENAGAAHSVGDPEDNTWVSVVLEGPCSFTRKDSA